MWENEWEKRNGWTYFIFRLLPKVTGYIVSRMYITPAILGTVSEHVSYGIQIGLCYQHTHTPQFLTPLKNHCLLPLNPYAVKWAKWQQYIKALYEWQPSALRQLKSTMTLSHYAAVHCRTLSLSLSLSRSPSLSLSVSLSPCCSLHCLHSHSLWLKLRQSHLMTTVRAENNMLDMTHTFCTLLLLFSTFRAFPMVLVIVTKIEAQISTAIH